MVAENTPANVSGISTSSIPSLEGSFEVNSVGNGQQNIFDGLVQRSNYWSAPEEPVDDRSLLLPDLETASAPAVMLMSMDEHGTPVITGSVSI